MLHYVYEQFPFEMLRHPYGMPTFKTKALCLVNGTYRVDKMSFVVITNHCIILKFYKLALCSE